MCRFVAVLAFFALAVSGTAAASPKDALHDAFSKFLAAKSFRATVTDVKKGQQLSAMEFVAPDRYHMKTGDGPETFIIGDDGYMNVNGRMMKMPIPVGKIIGQYRNREFLHEMENGMSIDDLGSDMLDGEAAHVYHYIVTQPGKADCKTWISDATGMPIQIESQGSFMGVKSTTRVRYGNFNDPDIRIDAPNS